MANYILVVNRILRELCKDFGVPTPELIIESPSKSLYGWYDGDNGIHICSDTLKSLSNSITTLRHEFAHYVQDLYDEYKKPELQAKRFEKNTLALEILPISQTRLTDFFIFCKL